MTAVRWKSKRSVHMPVSLYIRPTQQDVVAGTCNHPTKCMYALCLRRMFPEATYVSVNPNCITITLGGNYYHYTIPQKAVKNIVDYDDTKTVNPDKAAVTATLVGSKTCKYRSTEEAKEYHRKKSARRRADPSYVRPDSKQTLRGLLAGTRRLARQTGVHPSAAKGENVNG